VTAFLQSQTLDEALDALEANPGFIPVAGCTDLMVSSPTERADLPAVLDLSKISELSGIEETDRGLSIGATTTFTEIGNHRLIQERYPALAKAARVVGGWQIQNRATIGGNIANASPAGDSLPVLLALGAEIELAQVGQRRTLPYDNFHVGYRETALEANELVAKVHLPPPGPGSQQAFRKVGTREAQAISKVVVAAKISIEDGTIRSARIAAGSVAATPIRIAEAEERAIGSPANSETADAVGEVAAESVTPIDDVRSTADYRRFALRRVVRRLMLQMIENE